MTTYKYETHLHTSETSKCGKSSGSELAQYFKSLGYTGVFVTDHFPNANGPEILSWSEHIDLFCKGYDVTAHEGAKLGLDVFFAWEYSHGWAHFLTYGLGKDWLLANPDLPTWNVLDYFDRVHAAGGSVVHAHPFRENIEIVQLAPRKVDAVEIINPGRPDEANRHALDFAISHGLLKTAGSDIHSTRQKRLCGVTCSRRLTKAGDYIAAVRSGEAVIFDDNPIDPSQGQVCGQKRSDSVPPCPAKA